MYMNYLYRYEDDNGCVGSYFYEWQLKKKTTHERKLNFEWTGSIFFLSMRTASFFPPLSLKGSPF